MKTSTHKEAKKWINKKSLKGINLSSPVMNIAFVPIPKYCGTVYVTIIKYCGINEENLYWISLFILFGGQMVQSSSKNY